MFAKTIVLSDAFLDMPLSTRCLYFTLGMLADDDGFINSPKSIMRQCGASIDDLNLLVAKKFIIPFENGVVVIKHWRIHNYIQKDRYKGTKYIEEKNTLAIDEKGAYTTNKDDVSILDTQDRLELGKVKSGKDSIGKNNKAENPLDVLPENVRSAFNDFATMRKTKLKKPMTDNAIKRMLNKLNSLSTDESIQIAILNQSEDNCWLDIYPLKTDKPKQQKGGNPFLDMVEEGVFDE
jgi:hypothetical protein